MNTEREGEGEGKKIIRQVYKHLRYDSSTRNGLHTVHMLCDDSLAIPPDDQDSCNLNLDGR